MIPLDMLPQHVRSGFERHVRGCPGCRGRFARAAQLSRLRSASRLEERPVGWDAVPYTSMLSPVGMLWIAAGPRGLVRLASDEDEVTFCYAIERAGHGVPEYMPEALRDHVRQLAEYFEGRRTAFEMPVDLSRLGGFRRAALEAVLAVPYGTVRSYRDIARGAGRPRAARAVGTAVATTPISIVIPCHRIIRSDGTIGEYGLGACGVTYKRMLLALEGVTRAE